MSFVAEVLSLLAYSFVLAIGLGVIWIAIAIAFSAWLLRWAYREA